MAADHRASEARRDYDEWRGRYRSVVGADPPDIWQPPDDGKDVEAVRAIVTARGVF